MLSYREKKLYHIIKNTYGKSIARSFILFIRKNNLNPYLFSIKLCIKKINRPNIYYTYNNKRYPLKIDKSHINNSITRKIRVSCFLVKYYITKIEFY